MCSSTRKLQEQNDNQRLVPKLASRVIEPLNVPLVILQNILDLAQMLRILLHRFQALVGDHFAFEQQFTERPLRLDRLVLDVVPELSLTLFTAVILQVPRIVAYLPFHIPESRAQTHRRLQLLEQLAELVAFLARQLIDVIVEDALAIVALQLLHQFPAVILT